MKNEVIIGDCAEVLKQFDDESIDCIVTDPPYGISFMGKEWDKALPSIEALKECNRVLKHGAFGFFMCAPRMDVLWRMGQRLEGAGFRVDFSFIGWAFASGFPKSMDMSKAIDKKMRGNLVKDKIEYFMNKRGVTAQELTRKSGIASAASIGDWTKGGHCPSDKNWNLVKNALGVTEEEETAFEREMIGTGKCGKTAIMGGLQGIETNNGNYDITAPATDKAREFSGAFASFQPKPALEVIIVCMKNLSGKTYVDQALSNGKGVTWLSDCRIPCEAPHHDEAGRVSGKGFTKQGGDVYYSDPNGRFPANLLCSDDVLNDGNDHPSGSMNCISKRDNTQVYGKYNPKEYNISKSVGSFSRFFDLDVWFNKKINTLPPEQQKTFPFLITPKPSKSEKNKYIENKHPTVKPLKLMSYLITLGSREGDVILDPFAGSGTTLEACKLLNRVFIGIDKDPENEKYMVARGQLNTCTLSNFEEVV